LLVRLCLPSERDRLGLMSLKVTIRKRLLAHKTAGLMSLAVTIPERNGFAAVLEPVGR